MEISPALIALVIFAAMVAVPVAMRARRRPAVLAELRARWGRPLERPRDLHRIARYHELRAARDGTPAVDDGTWVDLAMDDVFERMDTAASAVGQQVLYDLLRTPRYDPAPLGEMDAHARRLAEDAALRERVQLAAHRVGTGDALLLCNLFLGELPARPAGWLLFPALTAVAAASVATAVFFPAVGLLAVLAITVVNLAVQHRYRGRIQGLVRPGAVLHALARAGEELAKIDDPALARPVGELRESAGRLRGIRRLAGYLVFERQGDDLADLAYAYLNMLFLLDVNAYVFSVEALRRRRADVERVFVGLGHLDAMAALASFRAGLDAWATPEFTAPAKRMELRGLRHPLLEDAVPNDLATDGAGVLITGSNMSGKTTFIRSVALNALLAQTVCTVAASLYRAPFLRVRAFIGREDSLREGKSYFFVEAETIGHLLRDAEGEAQHLFVIDEIFRGTNTVERIAAAAAVLERLNRGPHLVLVSTHDLELIELLGGAWEFHHFREEVDDGGLRFDYQIRPGASSTRNALRLLELQGYPPDVVRAAHATADALSASRGAAATPRE
jgi:MutS domain V